MRITVSVNLKDDLALRFVTFMDTVGPPKPPMSGVLRKALEEFLEKKFSDSTYHEAYQEALIRVKRKNLKLIK